MEVVVNILLSAEYIGIFACKESGGCVGGFCHCFASLRDVVVITDTCRSIGGGRGEPAPTGQLHA